MFTVLESQFICLAFSSPYSICFGIKILLNYSWIRCLKKCILLLILFLDCLLSSYQLSRFRSWLFYMCLCVCVWWLIKFLFFFRLIDPYSRNTRGSLHNICIYIYIYQIFKQFICKRIPLLSRPVLSSTNARGLPSRIYIFFRQTKTIIRKQDFYLTAGAYNRPNEISRYFLKITEPF